ncbi:PIG-U-domain-containing protein [Acaromyces ingoldii]|uniref:PIG-U-domain-containing protein n=1 Tax=Acaromyces ingoldii TaxID=215250 RepID=A0A316YWB3_9BASI|nr:PIG-U-domain-containing protein [Acaromyces ingoldii]PWN92333.1 PIG-U-domain-containing protein [Acaromyces ingoldii]
MTTSTSSSESAEGAVVVARTKKSPSSLLVPSLSTILLCGLALRLAVFLVPDLSAIPALLERRPELSTPVSSYLTFKEALHLRKLYIDSTASAATKLPKPYQSGTLYTPPLLLAFLGPLLESRSAEAFNLITALVWSIADLITAACLADAYSRRVQSLVHPSKTRREENGKGAARGLANGQEDALLKSWSPSKETIAALYLFNPFTLGTCWARCTTGLNNCFVVLAIDAALAASPIILAVSIATAALLSLYPALLLPALFLLCAQQATSSNQRRRHAKDRHEHQSRSFGATLALCVFLTLVVLAILVHISFLAAAMDWTFIDRAYGTILLVPDLSPNIGLWWYFFIEIFDHFRSFFLLAFNVHLASYAVPLTIKYRQDELFALTAFQGLISTFKSYPTMSDASLFLSLLSLSPQLFPYYRYPLVSLLLYTYATLLLPALHHLWLNAGSGNANFFYAITLVWALAQGATTLDAMWAWGRWRWELERPKMDPILAPKRSAKRRVVQL